ncbi:SwmB domain-containing protein [Paenibacillus bouchesdurhonensis]|uniref:SwmB domain-containing protein n=1 Tax=Paenibacillus bouchesdurhonensis TaxID=1870990 RepID=UPI000DA62684|nr:SwmB domain-containing protein [Paenibacillus bouchesdurhonensis]
MQRKISFLIVAVLMLNMLMGATTGATSGDEYRGGDRQVALASTNSLNSEGLLLNKGLLSVVSSTSSTYSPIGNEVPINTKLVVNFGAEKVRTNGKQTFTISRSISGYIEKMEVEIPQVSNANSIILTPPTNLQYGSNYTIIIPANAFIVGESNAAKSSEIHWSFTTASAPATAALNATAFSPTSGSSTVSVNAKPVITFNRNVSLNRNISNAGITLKKSSNHATVPITVTSSGNQVTISPSSSLETGISYYIEIPSNAVYDAQNSSIYYAGLSGTNRWTFQTGSTDKTAPVLQSATMYSNTSIRLLYNETLESYYSLSTSSFKVSVNGEDRRISSVSASGSSVYVYLETGVAVGQNVRISYTAGGVRPIQDLAGNVAVSFASREVTNGIDSVMPKPQEGYISGTTLTLRFSESLKDVSSYAYEQFNVTADGQTKGINRISRSGSYVYLYLNSSVSNGEVVKVSYTPGSYPLQDYRGQNISPFSDYFVRNYNDTKAPEFTKIEGSGTKIVITYNEALRSTSIPMKSQYSVLVNNSPIYVTGIEVLTNQVILTLASSFSKEQSVTLSYVSGVGGIADLNGNLAGYINLEPVNYSMVAEGIRSAIVRGDTITVTYNSTLRATSFVPANQFNVNVDQVNRAIQSVSVNGDTITIKLSTAVLPGQVVDLSYMLGSTPLYDNVGNTIKAYSRIPVQNLTQGEAGSSSSSGQPSYITVFSPSEFGVGGYLMSLNTAQAQESLTRNKQNIKKYVLDGAKLQEAYQFLISNNSAQRKLVFEVPRTEKAAEVIIPMSALVDMYSRGKTGSLAVRYQEMMYELPVEKIPFAEISRSLYVNNLNSAYLKVEIEPVARVQLPTQNYSNGVTITPTADPVQLYVSVYNGTATQNAVNVAHSGHAYFRVVNQGTTSQVSLLKYDLTARTSSFVPGKVTNSGSIVILSGKINGDVVIGPAAGYSYFTDTKDHWANASINSLAGKLIVEGRQGAKFDPNSNITRAEFAVFIAKGLGLEGDEASARRFPDVPSGTTGAYIGAAAKAGIIAGNMDGTFKPNSYITREQMSLMMVRAMAYAGHDISLNGSSAQTLNRFKDSAKIQSKDNVAKAVKEGIIQGVSLDTFQPQGNATRAQAAVMLKRVLEKLNYI